MRVAIWAAVSTKSQAEEEKESIPTQLEKGMDYIRAHNHTLTAQYILPGESRTKYISLNQAEAHIPQLKELMNAAAQGHFDILWLYDLNRLRNLMLQVFEALAGYGIQIYNHDDPDQPVHPKQYTPELINARRLNIKVHDIISGQETNTLQKHYREKMPRRITEKGLHPGLGKTLYGYRKPQNLMHDSKAILEIDSQQAAVVLQIKDWFLDQGLSLTAITERLNAAGTPSPRGRRWWFSIVRYILANPFYAGIVRFGVTKRNHDKRTITTTRTKGTDPVENQGVHTPLWDLATHKRILSELDRRASAQPGTATRIFTRLLRCECGAVLWAQVTPAGKYWRCSTLKKAHTYINDQTAQEIIIPKLIQEIKNANEINIPQPKDNTPLLKKEEQDLLTKQRRLLDLYEDSAIDKATYTARIQKHTDRLNAIRAQLEQTEHNAYRRDQFINNLTKLQRAINLLPQFIQTADPLTVNTTLHSILESIQITRKTHHPTFHWRL